MSNVSHDNNETKESILEAAEELFSQKGFDGTSVNEVAEKAGVNKPLIYYYFKSKEGVLNYMIDTLLKQMEAIALQALQDEKFKLLDDQKLKAHQDKLKLVNMTEADMDQYLEMSIRKSLDFFWDRRRVLKIMAMESLKKGNHDNPLFRIADLMNKNNLTEAFKEKEIQLHIDKDVFVERFFMGLMPMVNFVIYFDSWQQHYDMENNELKAIFIEKFKRIYGKQWISTK